ncbi:MAG: hypothetical protein HY870_06710 [Chloroflexi bacterium]|nr:hypothetical protein [Chloroflexota bacterium]
MARPPLQCEVVELHVHLRLRRGEDDDLIRFFEQAGTRQRGLALKIALRAGGLSEQALDDGPTEAELTTALSGFVFD